MKKNRRISETIVSLDKFFDIADQSLLVFGEGVRNYLHRDMTALGSNLQSIVKIQNEASMQSREIQTSLFSRSLSMGLQGDIFRLLEQMSHTIDMVNNCLFQFETERPAVPSELNQDYLKLLELSSQSLVHAIDASRSFFRDVDTIPEKVRRVYFYQKEADRQAKALKKRVFQQMNELKLSEKTHLRYFALHIEEIALQAMKVADQLSVMAIRGHAKDFSGGVSIARAVAYTVAAVLVAAVGVIASGVWAGDRFGLIPAAVATALIFVMLGLYFNERRSRRSSGKRLKAQEDEINANSRKLSEMEVQIMTMENNHLQNLLELKRKETTGIAEKMTEHRDFMDSIYNMVVQAQQADDDESRDRLLHELKTRLSLRNNFSDENEFYSQVESLHEDFSVRLSARFPQLTAQERKLATLLRLEFTSKYIATLLNISTKSVEIERHRLRKKMGLERGQNLIEFIKTI